jgi:SAM-dependent methyltransferase
MNLDIEPAHFQYLQIQHGRVSDQRSNFSKWKAAYEESLDAIYASLLPVLPERADTVVDVGSGLGGINILLAQHYSPELAIRLVDGFNDPADVVSHVRTFNDMEVAKHFLALNGCKNVGGIRPGEDWRCKADIVVSFAAWCFHVPPSTYFSDLMANTKPGAKVIVDVRRAKKEWLREMISLLGKPEVLSEAEKYVRCSFTRP